MLSVLLGVAAFAGVPAAAVPAAAAGTPGVVADAGSGPGDDGNLHLIPDIITNSGISAGGSGDFPLRARLFLPEAQDRSKQLAWESAALGDRIAQVPFSQTRTPSSIHPYAAMRSRLFDGYTPRAIVGGEEKQSASSIDILFIVMLSAAVPGLGLAVLLGIRVARRRAKRHA